VLVLALVFAIWGWFDVRLRGTVDPHNRDLHKTDFTVYTEAGAAFFDGRNPYGVTNPRGWGYLYPPLFAMLVAPLHALDPRMQVLAWFALNSLMAWGCYRECVRVGRVLLPDEPQRASFGSIPTWAGYAAIAAPLFPALNCLQRGQVGIVKVYFILLGFRLLIESQSAVRAWLAGCVLAIPCVLKITPLLPVGFIIFQQAIAAWYAQPRDKVLSRALACPTGVISGLALGVFIVPAALVGWSQNIQNLHIWWDAVAVRVDDTASDNFAGDSFSIRNQSLMNATYRFFNWASYEFNGGKLDGHRNPNVPDEHELLSAPVIDAALYVVRFGAACLLIVVGFRSGRSQDPVTQAAAFGMACVATLVLSPIARGHYYVMTLPATMFLAMWLDRRTWSKGTIVLLVVPALLTLLHYAWMGTAGRMGLLGLGTAVWYIVAMITLLRSPIALEEADILPFPAPLQRSVVRRSRAA